MRIELENKTLDLLLHLCRFSKPILELLATDVLRPLTLLMVKQSISTPKLRRCISLLEELNY